MRVTIVGTGFIGGVLGRALAGSGQDVTFASRHPQDDVVAGEAKAQVAPVGEARLRRSCHPGATGRGDGRPGKRT